MDNFKNFINKAEKIHNYKFNYDLVDYKNARTKVKIICPVHGIFEQTPDSHLSCKDCRKCSYNKIHKNQLKSKETFINQANKIHNFKYEYDKIEYKGDNKELLINCKLHGDFLQKAGKHLSGHGCRECGKLKSKNFINENPNGWSLTNWIKSASNSKDFDSFKIYIIKCWSEQEEFYKIGRTYKKVKKRFESKTLMPYNWKIIKIIEGTVEEIYKLEIELKKLNKPFKYTPNIIFDGRFECFRQINYK